MIFDRLKLRRVIRIFAADVVILVIAYILGGIYLRVNQHDFLFAPPPDKVGPPAAYGLQGVQELKVGTEDGLSLRAWLQKPWSRPVVIVFFHGNGYNLPGAATIMPPYIKHGYGVFLCEYRGYSGNSGKPTEPGLYVDARGCVNSLNGMGYDAKHIVLYGASLGTGVATQLATEKQFAAVVLESPFTSLVDLDWPAFRGYPSQLIWKDRFDSIRKIAKISAPLLVIHGVKDDIVPIEMGQLMFNMAQEPKTFFPVANAGHNDLYEHGADEIIASWLDKNVKVGELK